MTHLILTIIGILLGAIARLLGADLARVWRALPVWTGQSRPRLTALAVRWSAWTARMPGCVPLLHARRALVAPAQSYSAP